MTVNCLNCGAPIQHLTNGWICEYCGSTGGVDYVNALNSKQYTTTEIYADDKMYTVIKEKLWN